KGNILPLQFRGAASASADDRVISRRNEYATNDMQPRKKQFRAKLRPSGACQNKRKGDGKRTEMHQAGKRYCTSRFMAPPLLDVCLESDFTLSFWASGYRIDGILRPQKTGCPRHESPNWLYCIILE